MDELTALMKSYYDNENNQVEEENLNETEDDENRTDGGVSSKSSSGGSSRKRKRGTAGDNASADSCGVDETSNTISSSLLELNCAFDFQKCTSQDSDVYRMEPFHRSPVLELWLGGQVRRLHSKMETVCKEEFGLEFCKRLALFTSATLRNGDALFEKWLLSAMSCSNELYFGLLPDDTGCTKASLTVFLADLHNVCRTDKERELSRKVASTFAIRYNQFLSKTAKIPNEESKKNRRKVAKVERGKGKERKSLVSFGGKSLKISDEHLDKLAILFQMRHSGLDFEQVKASREFRNALFSLLLRYETIGGPGFQAAIPRVAFQVLTKQFGVNFECFASPLNCRYTRFCSAFFDTDAAFGSCGSFFDFHPDEGSFEANPPFVDSVVEQMKDHIEKLLSSSQSRKRALSFIIIVPSRYRDMIQRIAPSFYKCVVTLDHREHSYMAGAQQRSFKSRKKIASTCDTDVHIVQTDAACKKWPVSEEKLEKLRLAFQVA